MYHIASDKMTATLHTLGARMSHIGFRNGPNLVLDADPTAHPAWADAYGGVVIGPVANRVQDGRVTIAGNTFQMPQNEGATCLHSGPEGLHARDWAAAQTRSDTLELSVTLQDGDCGLPGTRHITARFRLTGTELHVQFLATTDRETPMSLAHHPYWALGGIQRLESTATHYLPTDDAQIPTGEVASTVDTPFNYSEAREFPPLVDHNLCWGPDGVSAPGAMATLMGDNAIMTVTSDQPGLQVYNGAGLPTIEGTGIEPFAGVALEPQNWPNAINTDHFPSILLTPGTQYRQSVRYRFETAAQKSQM